MQLETVDFYLHGMDSKDEAVIRVVCIYLLSFCYHVVENLDAALIVV